MPQDDSRDTSETEPLLATRDHPDALSLEQPRTPLPQPQFFILIFLQVAEPFTSQVVYPFAPQLVRDVGITKGDEAKVGYYVGIIHSLFFLTQALTVFHYARLSDKIGRKPVVLVGLVGLSLSMFCFGLSRTFVGMVLSRSLNGALNGNIGVIRSMVVEMTDSTNIAQAYAYMPLGWSLGGVLGNMIGGSLAHPADRFPNVFGESPFMQKYPYFLACAIPATFSIIAWFVTLFFLKETAIGSSVLSIWRIFRRDPSRTTTLESCPPEAGVASTVLDECEAAVPLRGLLTRPVILAASCYALLACMDMLLRAIHPLFLATPIPLGGLGLDTQRIGQLLTLIPLLYVVFFFRRMHDYLGSKVMFTLGMASVIPTFAAFPLLSSLAQAQGMSGLVYAVAVAQIFCSIGLSFSYRCAVFIYISAAAPNRASVGATNGLCQLCASSMRAIAPAASVSLFALSIEQGYLGGWMVYYVLIAAACGAVGVALQLPSRS
ncbi:major facilitator superfamily multidrug-resistance, DHA1 sub-family, partial [Mycena filopes]